MIDSFYRDFEDRYRGPRDLIKSRMGAYAPFVEPLAALYRPADAPVLGRAAKRLVIAQHRYIHPPATAVDLGCGRGEWLELAGELGFDASGADLDEGMLAACRERGLNACKADAIETLRALPDASTALVSAFHLVEHLPFNEVRTLVREALRVLKPGGLLILETPNPENLLVSSTEFYMDPSHERPIPSGLLGFAVEHAGFLRDKIVRLHESAGRPTAVKDGLVGVLYDVSFDYGIVAQKNATAEVLSRFDEPFNAEYGASLVALAQQYDLQAENRAAHIEERFAQAEARAAQIEAQAEAHAAQIEAHMAQITAQLLLILNSRSWRITAPLRYAKHIFHRFRSAAREGRLISASKKRIRALLHWLGQFVLRRARFLKNTLGMINPLPPAAQPADELSPRATRIYTMLKKDVAVRKN